MPRFLKPPPIKCELYQPFNIVWTIESDLGDHSFDQSVLLTCQTTKSSIVDIKFLPINKPTKKRKKGNDNSNNNGKEIIEEQQQKPSNLLYEPQRGSSGIVTRMMLVPTSDNNDKNMDQYKRKGKKQNNEPTVLDTTKILDIQLEFSLSTEYRKKNDRGIKNKDLYMEHKTWYHAYCIDASKSIFDDNNNYNNNDMWIIPIWSVPIQLDTSPNRQNINEIYTKDPSSGQQAQRVIMVGDDQLIYIYEDIEESIARHVWDCGLVMCDFINKNKKTLNCQHIIELGSGTGIVGVYTAMALKPKSMDLTDLSDAVNILQQNIDTNFNNRKKAEMELTIEAKVLPWGPFQQLITKNKIKDDNDMLLWQQNDKKIDMVLLTDVLYNYSSHDILLETLTWLIEINPKARVLLGYKERNSDERSFFTKINQHPLLYCIKNEHQLPPPFEIYWILKKK